MSHGNLGPGWRDSGSDQSYMKAPMTDRERAIEEAERVTRRVQFEQTAREAMKKYSVLNEKRNQVNAEINQLMSELDNAQVDAWDAGCEEQYRMKVDFEVEGAWFTRELVLNLVWDDEVPPQFKFEPLRKYLSP